MLFVKPTDHNLLVKICRTVERAEVSMPRGSARCNVKVLFLLLARRAFKNKKKMQTLIGEKVDLILTL